MDKKRKIGIAICISLVIFIILGSFYLGYLTKANKEKELQEKATNEALRLQKEKQSKLKREQELANKEKLLKIEKEQEEQKRIKETFYNNTYPYLNNMDFKNLKEPNYMISYEDDNYQSILGLDISEFNGQTNFYKLKEQGIDYVMLRVGWRGSTEGKIYLDKHFEEYYKEAVDSGLKIGFYFFSQARNEEEAKEEALFVLDNIDGKQCDMFVAYDLETSIDRDGRSDNISASQRTKNAIAFSNAVKEKGYDPMIYTNLDWAYNYYDVDSFFDNNIPIWLAQYEGYPKVDFKYLMWQYTSSASINGTSLKGHTDINMMLLKK